MKEQETKIETFRSHLLDRIREHRVGAIGYNSEGRPTFDVDPETSNYTWVFDLADREGLLAELTGIGVNITITEEKTND
jgi:hypothetical protein